MTLGRWADFDVNALYAALDAQRRGRALSWQGLARELRGFSAGGISPSTLSGMRTRRALEADGILQVLRWLRRTPESFVPGSDLGASECAELPEVGAQRVLRFDTQAIYEALDARRRERGMTWRRVAEEIGGCTAANLTHLSRGGRTAFPLVMRLCRWLGRPAASFTRARDR